MLGLAQFAMRSPARVGILSAVFALVPMLYIFSAALVALTTLRQGTTAGTQTLAVALLGGLASWFVTGVPLSLLVITWVMPLAVVLRTTQSWTRTLLVGSFSGLLLAIIASSLFQVQFDAAIEMIQTRYLGSDQSSPEWSVMEALKPTLGFLVVSAQLIETTLALLLARYWQAGLYNPGGLRSELHDLRFDKPDMLALLVCVAFAFVLKPSALLLFCIPFIFAGMALIHGMVARLNLGKPWLVAAYVALILFNQIMLPLLIVAVVADCFLQIRDRFERRG